MARASRECGREACRFVGDALNRALSSTHDMLGSRSAKPNRTTRTWDRLGRTAPLAGSGASESSLFRYNGPMPPEAVEVEAISEGG